MRQQAPGGDQVIDLDLRAEIPVEQAQQLGAVGRDAFLAAEKRAQDQRARADQLGQAQRDHGERGAAALGRDPAKNNGKQQPGEAADQRHDEKRESAGLAAMAALMACTVK